MLRSRFASICLSGFFVLFFGVSKTRALGRYEIIEKYSYSVAQIERWEIGGSNYSWSGSGFFYTKTRVVTNAHVIGLLTESAEEFQAVHANEDIARAIYWIVVKGKKYKARFVGRDPNVDIGILETIEEIPGVAPAALGNSDNMRVGHPVLIIGSPYGFADSVSDGIISAKQRKHGLVAFEDYLQTTAPINPGNSGGPLISAETGEVIGIVNSGIQFSDGMGFAIPINIFRYAERDILNGTVRRSWFGIQFPFEEEFRDTGEFQTLIAINRLIGIDKLNILQQIRRELFVDGGVLITDVMQREVQHFTSSLKCADPQNAIIGDPIPPAKKADLRIGDIIKSFGIDKIANSRELIYAIFKSMPCKSAMLRIVRFDENGVRQEVNIDIVPILRNPHGVSAGYY